MSLGVEADWTPECETKEQALGIDGEPVPASRVPPHPARSSLLDVPTAARHGRRDALRGRGPRGPLRLRVLLLGAQGVSGPHLYAASGEAALGTESVSDCAVIGSVPNDSTALQGIEPCAGRSWRGSLPASARGGHPVYARSGVEVHARARGSDGGATAHDAPATHATARSRQLRKGGSRYIESGLRASSLPGPHRRNEGSSSPRSEGQAEGGGSLRGGPGF